MSSFCSIKCWFIFFNTLFLFSGVALITIGALQYSTFVQMSSVTGSGPSKIAISLIAVGVTITLVSVLGYFGAILNNSSMVVWFVCILIVIILLEVLTGAAFFMLFKRAALVQVKNYIGSNKPVGKSIKLKGLSWRGHGGVAGSCCLFTKEGCRPDEENVALKGCAEAVQAILLKNVMWIGGICIALGVAEVFGVLVGVCLCLDIKRKNYVNVD